jgi:hypothetical protein
MKGSVKIFSLHLGTAPGPNPCRPSADVAGLRPHARGMKPAPPAPTLESDSNCTPQAGVYVEIQLMPHGNTRVVAHRSFSPTILRSPTRRCSEGVIG